MLFALALTAFCGLSVLAMTAIDLLAHAPRSGRLRPIRAFDVIIGLALAVPSLVKWAELLPDSLG